MMMAIIGIIFNSAKLYTKHFNKDFLNCIHDVVLL